MSSWFWLACNDHMEVCPAYSVTASGGSYPMNGAEDLPEFCAMHVGCKLECIGEHDKCVVDWKDFEPRKRRRRPKEHNAPEPRQARGR